MINPIIQAMQARAELLDIQESTQGLDDALANLAGWLEMRQEDLHEDDVTVLLEVGGILYREGLKRRMGE
ncbi:hypothetical protein E4O98_07885 [Pseudomonas sp. W2Jun17]|nr:hypothetical protein [Pseudomonas sp. W2Jun17]